MQVTLDPDVKDVLMVFMVFQTFLVAAAHLAIAIQPEVQAMNVIKKLDNVIANQDQPEETALNAQPLDTFLLTMFALVSLKN